VVYTVGVRESLDSECWSLCFMECYDAEDEQNISLGMTLTAWSSALVNGLRTAVSRSVNSERPVDPATD
jgi:hypothetical protein